MTSTPLPSTAWPDRVLHERVGDEDEVRGQPTADRHAKRGEEVHPRSEALLSPHERPDERALEQEREHPLHRERLPDDAAGVLAQNPAQLVPN